MTALALPAKADTPLWKNMDNAELQSFAKAIVRNIEISPETAFGVAGDFGDSRLRVRTYPRGNQGLLVVESSIAKDGNPAKEVIRSIQLKQVRDNGSVELLWEVLRGEPGTSPAQINAKGLRWTIELKKEKAKWRNGPTDVPPGKVFRSVS